MKIISLLILVTLSSSCANLYRERAYVTKIDQAKKMKGGCNSENSQNKFVLDTRKGEIQFSTPVHYDYWWTGPIIFPLVPLNKERKDPSFIKITLKAKEEVLDREELLKSEIHLQGRTDPILPMNVVYTSENEDEKFVIQFDSPELVDVKQFKLKLPEKISRDALVFDLARDTHYVPIVPVTHTECVTD